MDERNARSALIVAAEPADAASALRATLPFLGATLVEHQVRQAVAAGAVHVVVLVATMPPALLAALDRLRRGGVAIEVARNLADAADRIHPSEAVLLVADGCLADQAMVERIAAVPPPALLVCPATADAAFERIDAVQNWAGLALVDGALVRKTASAPGEWDPQSTLLRRAVQAGAARVEAGGAPPVAMRKAALGDAALGARMFASAAREGAWTHRWLLSPAAAPFVRLLAARPLEPAVLGAAAGAMGLASALLAIVGWPSIALAVMLLSGLVLAVGRRLARLRLQELPREGWWQAARIAGATGALAAVALAQRDWGWPVVAALTPLAFAASLREQHILARAGGTSPAIVADLDGLGWVAAIGYGGGGWSGALAAMAAYALVSFILVQERVSRAV